MADINPAKDILDSLDKVAKTAAVINPSANLLDSMKVEVRKSETLNRTAGEPSGFKYTLPGTSVEREVYNPKCMGKGYISAIKQTDVEPADGGYRSTLLTYNQHETILDELRLSFNTRGNLVTTMSLKEDGVQISDPKIQKYKTTLNGLTVPEPTANKYEVSEGTTEFGKRSKYGIRLNAEGQTYKMPFGNPPKDNTYGLGPIADIKISPLTKATTGEFFKMEYVSVDQNNRAIDKGYYVFDKDYKLVGSVEIQNDGDTRTTTTVAGFYSLSDIAADQKILDTTPVRLDEKNELFSKLSSSLQMQFKAIMDQVVAIDMYQVKDKDQSRVSIIYSKGEHAIWGGYSTSINLTPDDLNSSFITSAEEIIRRSKDYDAKKKLLNSVVS